MQLDTLRYIQNEIRTEVGDVENRLLVFNSVSTMGSIILAVENVIRSLREDHSMRCEIVAAMKTASTEQTGVYLSAWKYSPCIDKSAVDRFEAIVTNELETSRVYSQTEHNSTLT